MLKVRDLNSGYGDVQILWNFNVEIEEGSITALIGSNGVGKTTFLRTIVGEIEPYSGSIIYNGEDITRENQIKRVKKGIIMIPEGRQLYRGLTIEENLKMGAYARKDSKKKIREDIEWVYSILPRLKERRKQPTGTLSGGEAQMCAIGRGLMGAPKLLLIDELSLGLAPVIVDDLIELLKNINKNKNMTILLVDQDVQTALEIARKGYVVVNGRVEMADNAEILLNNPEIQKAYLGI
ncbi:MAG: ABC transporter ATP-binding protein [Spirochaetes bacterium]|nr:ABC transporter ATP-binding protein [Spirochaetota bacterium]